MRTVLRSYEPVFGGIVAILAGSLLCVALFVPTPGGFDRSTVHVIAYSATGLAWGVLQVVGYRSAKRKNVALAEPTLGVAEGCVLFGLILVLATICYWELANDPKYAIAIGLVAAIILCIGAVVGIRQGTWK